VSSPGAAETLVGDDTGATHVGAAPEIAARSPWELFRRRIVADKVTLVALMFIIFLIVIAIFAKPITELVGARPPNEQSTRYLDAFGSAAAPSSENLFGTDSLGRDVFSRTLYGARVSLLVALISTALTVLIGVTVGLFAGYYRGVADTVLSRAMDVMLAFPVLLLALGLGAACSFGDGCNIDGTPVGLTLGVIGVAAAIGVGISAFLAVRRGRRLTRETMIARLWVPAVLIVFSLGLAWFAGETTVVKISPGLPVVIFVIVIASWPYIARVIRGQTLSLREKEFVEAARALGSSDRRIMFRHILPNLIAPIIVYTTLLVPTTILFEAALSFLGVGVEPPTASWGDMISDATEIFDTAWWYMTFPGVALLLTVLAFNLVGDGLQDALNPKTSGR
jgi:ABC-type dipeptide/oligopeptide/nickel transport system permease subunit